MITKNKKQLAYSDIKHLINEHFREAMAVPDYAQADLNLVNMANFFPLIQGVLDAVAPKLVCEIGSDEGATTKKLYEYCRSIGARLHAVDPTISDPKIVSDDTISYFPELSLSYLERGDLADIYFIDGDHNYYTVSSELNLLDKLNRGGKPVVIFLHDISWPWGSRDGYYNLNTIEEQHRHHATSEVALSIFTSNKGGLPMGQISVSEVIGGERNGVNGAVIDFLKESSSDWQYFSIPSIYGLGVLFCGVEDGALKNELVALERSFAANKEFFSILEFNRLLLLEEQHRQGLHWHDQQKHIAELEQSSADQQKHIAELEQSSADQQKHIAELEQSSADQQKHIAELLTRQGYLESFRGSVRQVIKKLIGK
jgi:uncharacterized coiled-coil protein SlyX